MAQKVATLLLLNLFLATLSRIAAATSPAVYVFGDSSVDVGNNNFLPSDAPKANFPPNGIDYPGRIPTGRFGNGFIGVDYIAKALGLAMSPPSFLSLANSMQMPKGVNFASAGSGILDTTNIINDRVDRWCKGTDVITMAAQIKDFEGVAANLTAKTGKKFASAYLKKSLFLVSVGSNDLFALFSLISPVNRTQKDEVVVLVINKFKNQLKTLYDLGARKFAVTGTGMIGCSPAVRRTSPSADCNPYLNDLSLRLKTTTKALLEELSMSLKGFKYSFADSYEMGVRVAADPHKYGFTELKAACCGSGRLNAEGPCAPNATYCSNRGQYLFWDVGHPSQAAYKLEAHLSLYGPPLFAYPVNIHRLVKG